MTTNTPGYNRFRIQLKDLITKQSLIASGAAGAGQVFVAIAGTPQKETLTDRFGNSLSNPLALTRGFIDFCVNIAHLTVDLYIQSPTGHFLVLKGVSPSGLNEYEIDTSNKRQMMVIPFNIGDTTAATETNTGFLKPTNSMVLDRLHGLGINVTTAETAGAKTMTAGLLSSQTGGNASGYINGSSTATLGLVIGTNGSLFSSNAPDTSSAEVANTISYTLVSSSVAAQGFIEIPYVLY